MSPVTTTSGLTSGTVERVGTTTVRLATNGSGPPDAAAVVVGIACDADGVLPLAGHGPVGWHLAGVQAIAALLGCRGREGELQLAPSGGTVPAPLLVLVGLGRRDAPVRAGHEVIRRAAGTAIRALRAPLRGFGPADVVFHLADALPGLDPAAGVEAVTEGALLGGYHFDEYRQHSREPGLGDVTVHVFTPEHEDRALPASVRRSSVVAEHVVLARDLVNTPAADLTPAAFAELVQRDSGDLGVEVLDHDALIEHGFGAIVGVGQGSVNPPRLVRVTYSPSAVSEPLRVALIGKGITFDSGGLDLKQNDSMAAMYSDMAGAAAVYATVRAAARLQLPVAVTAWLPLAENMPSGGALRPSDVLRSYDGRTVEVGSPDAEGRLVLGDAIGRAVQDEPDVVIDIATLTGAHTTSMGPGATAVMANDDRLRQVIVAAGEASGEFCWPMPLPADLRPKLDSRIADLRNSGGRSGALALGGLYLREFVPAGIRWAHLDIGGAQLAEEAFGYTPAGATGVGVRTLVRTLETLPGDAV